MRGEVATAKKIKLGCRDCAQEINRCNKAGCRDRVRTNTAFHLSKPSWWEPAEAASGDLEGTAAGIPPYPPPSRLSGKKEEGFHPLRLLKPSNNAPQDDFCPVTKFRPTRDAERK